MARIGQVQSVRLPDRASARRFHGDLSALPPELDCLTGVLAPKLLLAAAARAERLGIGAEQVLIVRGYLSERDYLSRLSLRTGIRIADFGNLRRDEITLDDSRLPLAAQSGILSVKQNGRDVTVFAPRQLAARTLARIAKANPRDTSRFRLCTDKALHDLLLYGTDAIVDHASASLRNRHPLLCAAPVKRHWLIRTVQRSAVGSLVLLVVAAALWLPGIAADLLALVFIGCIALRLLAASLPPRRQRATVLHGDAGLPTYSLIVPLYREASSVPQLLAALLALDYPPEKLDILIVVETDDLATRAAIARQSPPATVRVIVAPDKGPRTKPKALNVALPFARGSFVAVYDAEDRPDPQQLRKALAAFAEGGHRLACVQARLAIDNTADSLLTRMFAAEYAAQFELVLPGYGRLGLPFPLGGTSNHFRTGVLRDVGAWDAYNVTEDADLGLRLARFGYRIGTIDSVTFEEAPITPRAWLGQRRRWMKGWMQTWWVHARTPRRVWRSTGWAGLLARDAMIGGALLAALALPLLPVAIALWSAGVWPDDTPLFSTLHKVSFVSGLAATMALWLRGLARQRMLRHGWVVLLVPLHWTLLWIAAWQAAYELSRAPTHWSKTEHGLTRRRGLWRRRSGRHA